ncbi:hypothetical protein AXF42_Ash008638 [Apostasia shenzhenica]|uniref:Uncharacterized protein n=1 Tax=Apostasia shenzhenica TaxID=1088818 RepID=A0A2I0B1X6_9ASPA|nr:hypothetical protein AXF42_Ash008638 [Apostasia shenzhenica]
MQASPELGTTLGAAKLAGWGRLTAKMKESYRIYAGAMSAEFCAAKTHALSPPRRG